MWLSGKQDESPKSESVQDSHDGTAHEPAVTDSHDSSDAAAKTQGHSAGQSHDGQAHQGGSHTDSHAGADGFTPEEGLEVYMDAGHLFAHVQDGYEFDVPHFVSATGKLEVPNLTGATQEKPLLPGITGRPSKFMVLEVIAALLIVVAYSWVARRIGRDGNPPRGRLWNFLESIVCFVRDDIARPTIGKADADRFLPFLLTLFFFIIVLNLLGMIPLMGSPTASIAVTAVFAVLTFLVVIGSGMRRLGVVGFLKAQVPHMDLSPALALVLVPSIWLIEIFGLFVKHFVLAIRLFANMFAGHLVLAVFLGFIGVTWGSALVYGVAPAVVLVSIALSLLELFVACLQAYVFTFLAALFIGAALHPH